jgi:microcystin-dependent protein
MSNPYVGEIRLFAGNFAPDGWAFCDGQLLAIATNEVLFDLIGTTYGGDGQTTYAVPDLRGRVPVHQGNNTQSNYVTGQSGGVESVTLTTNQMPAHTHAMYASTSPASAAHGPSEVLGSSTAMSLYGTGAPNMAMDPNALTPVGGNQPHENMPPFVALSYIISMFGIFPSQN